MSKKSLWILGSVLASVGAAGLAFASGASALFDVPRPLAVYRYFSGSALPSNPFLANGVGVGEKVPTYIASGTGPSGANPLAPGGTPARYIHYDLLAITHPAFVPTDADKAAGVLPEGVTITEAQGLNAMAAVEANLAGAGLTLEDVLFMRIFLDNPPDAAVADYAGWNRAYRKYMANLDLNTGAVIGSFAPVIFENATRPARSNIEVATLPVTGWLIEIEVVAAFPTYVECYVPFLCLK